MDVNQYGVSLACERSSLSRALNLVIYYHMVMIFMRPVAVTDILIGPLGEVYLCFVYEQIETLGTFMLYLLACFFLLPSLFPASIVP